MERQRGIQARRWNKSGTIYVWSRSVERKHARADEFLLFRFRPIIVRRLVSSWSNKFSTRFSFQLLCCCVSSWQYVLFSEFWIKFTVPYWLNSENCFPSNSRGYDWLRLHFCNCPVHLISDASLSVFAKLANFYRPCTTNKRLGGRTGETFWYLDLRRVFQSPQYGFLFL